MTDNLNHRIQNTKKFLFQEKEFKSPNKGGNVLPCQICPAFYRRQGVPESEAGCWYCKHADFHLNKERALDIGICEWPEKIIN